MVVVVMNQKHFHEYSKNMALKRFHYVCMCLLYTIYEHLKILTMLGCLVISQNFFLLHNEVLVSFKEVPFFDHIPLKLSHYALNL
jgi:hypothetical protein